MIFRPRRRNPQFYRGGASALDTTTSAVSKRIAKLEERLGARLVERTTRRVSPTDAGVAFYERCARILADIDDAEIAVARLGREPRGTLRVSVPVIFGELHIAPLLPEFAARFPDVRLDMSLSDRLVNMLEEGFDMSVRISSMNDSSLVARKLAAAHGVVVASPAYFENARHAENAERSQRPRMHSLQLDHRAARLALPRARSRHFDSGALAIADESRRSHSRSGDRAGLSVSRAFRILRSRVRCVMASS